MKARRARWRPGNGADLPASRLLPFKNVHPKRLSATDISALASMKNVAKCDTWCELQNPVNHRVFERKLRPKPSGRGHACLGVTQRRQRPILRAWRMMASREPRLPAGRKGGPTWRPPRSTVV
ncbi:hypothetical protein K1719_047195 [Acacia pycnantha]|nr:hypothetical protein K1719_047480 [Acacia pycnantha]KAI9070842.1 hypothetical protein K1719_047187 [Acacia pycnantha]KAI9070850.1 hypothetical protein K1719_047195 [Acacia pycnantha]